MSLNRGIGNAFKPFCKLMYCRPWIFDISTICISCWHFCFIMVGCHHFLAWRVVYKENATCKAHLFSIKTNQYCHFFRYYFFSAIILELIPSGVTSFLGSHHFFMFEMFCPWYLKCRLHFYFLPFLSCLINCQLDVWSLGLLFFVLI